MEIVFPIRSSLGLVFCQLLLASGGYLFFLYEYLSRADELFDNNSPFHYRLFDMSCYMPPQAPVTVFCSNPALAAKLRD